MKQDNKPSKEIIEAVERLKKYIEEQRIKDKKELKDFL